MQQDIQAPTPYSPSPINQEPVVTNQPQMTTTGKPHGHRLYWVIIVLIILLAAGTNAWQYKTNHKATDNLGTTNPAVSTKTTSNSSNQYATATSIGYPLSLAKKEVLTTLSLPAGYTILQPSQGPGSQDGLAEMFTESSNDVIANWQFTKAGTSDNPSQAFSPNDSTTITATNGWEAAKDATTVNYDATPFNPASAAMTTTQKSVYIKKIQNDTLACAADSTKGFVTNDKVYNVCYLLQHPQAAGAAYMLAFEGFASVQGTSLYMRGVIELPTSYDGTSKTQFVLDGYLTSLKMLSTTVKANPLTQ